MKAIQRMQMAMMLSRTFQIMLRIRLNTFASMEFLLRAMDFPDGRGDTGHSGTETRIFQPKTTMETP